MNQMEFKILKRAQENAKEIDKLKTFLANQGVNLTQVKKNPERYQEIIRRYSKDCINIGLFEESRERLEIEFSRLCEYHRKNESMLVDQFYNVAKEIILSTPEGDNNK